MLKYAETRVTFGEVPSEVTLCINITGCKVHCPDCHSKWLWEDTGEELTTEKLSELISKNDGISCIAFMGGDSSPEDIYSLSKWVKDNTNLKVCWYSGLPLRHNIPLPYFDYIKTGSYKKELGGLDSVTTNQRFYQVLPKYDFNSNTILYHYLEDITFKFQKYSDEDRDSSNMER